MPEIDLMMLDMDRIEPNPFQPRERFEHKALRDLSDSIGELGILQPILVRPKGKKYQIIAGERRWRACLDSGEKEIPALIRDMNDSELQIASLIENVHRENLSPIEQANALVELGKSLDLIDESGTLKTKKKDVLFSLNKKTKIHESLIAQRFELLDLPEYIQQEIKAPGSGAGKKMPTVTEDHALSLKRISDKKKQKKVFDKIKDEGLSTKQTRKLAKVVENAPQPIADEVVKKKPAISTDSAEKILELEDEKAETIVLEEAKKYDYSEREIEERVEDIKFSKEKGIESPAIEPPMIHDPNKDFVDDFKKITEGFLVINPKRFSKITQRQKDQILTMVEDIEDRCREIRKRL